MHHLAEKAVASVLVHKKDGAQSAIAELALASLSGEFAATSEIKAHLDTLVAAHKLYRRGLKVAAKQLAQLAELGAPLAERLGNKIAKKIRHSSKALSAFDNTTAQLKRPQTSGAGLRTMNKQPKEKEKRS